MLCHHDRVSTRLLTTVIVAIALCSPGCKKKEETVEPEDDTWVPDESNEPPIAIAPTNMSEEERTAQAKDLYTRAEAKAEAEDWAGALPLYEQAYQLMPEKHGFALKVGDTATKLGDCAKATIYYQHFLNYAEADKYKSDIKRVKKVVADGCAGQ
jgi:tetratricopeptide (TPR) repeat protein